MRLLSHSYVPLCHRCFRRCKPSPSLMTVSVASRAAASLARLYSCLCSPRMPVPPQRHQHPAEHQASHHDGAIFVFVGLSQALTGYRIPSLLPHRRLTATSFSATRLLLWQRRVLDDCSWRRWSRIGTGIGSCVEHLSRIFT